MVRSGRNSNSSEILCMSSLPASIKRIGSKTTEKRWRHRFPHYKPMGAFCCYGNQSFDPICPKALCSLSPTPVMLHIICYESNDILNVNFGLFLFFFKSNLTPRFLTQLGNKFHGSYYLCTRHAWVGPTRVETRVLIQSAPKS